MDTSKPVRRPGPVNVPEGARLWVVQGVDPVTVKPIPNACPAGRSVKVLPACGALTSGSPRAGLGPPATAADTPVTVAQTNDAATSLKPNGAAGILPEKAGFLCMTVADLT
jgi:hypothetical protein